jgi:hypothetical protein
MFYPFFALAAQSPTRQQSLRWATAVHVQAVGFAFLGVQYSSHPRDGTIFLGHFLLVAGIVEGALLLGWRLAQLPKSQSLEFLLASPLRPAGILVAEACVGLARLALVTLSGLPVLLLFIVHGLLLPIDLVPLLVMPFTWGALAGMGLTAWAYEKQAVRRWGERLVLGLVVLYLVVGVLAGENLKSWLDCLPEVWGRWFYNGFEALHRYNPFGVIRFWLTEDPVAAREQMVGLEIAALLGLGLVLTRAVCRLGWHFHDLHYRPVQDQSGMKKGIIGDRPLSWWAVRRVLKYSGRVNLWLAGGFGLLYAAHTLAGPRWPPWLGRQVFVIFNQIGGIPVLASALVLLAAVPAAFQYGLWDSNGQDRCRRLELLLLTRLDARDYWDAAAAAALRRGRGYFGIALVLWAAALGAGQLTLAQTLGALAAGVILWGLYFALGFRAFARGLQANGLGTLLTIGLPLLVYALHRAGCGNLADLLPPGSVYRSGSKPLEATWGIGPVIAGLGAIVLASFGQARCEQDLRAWYDGHHGRKVMN